MLSTYSTKNICKICNKYGFIRKFSSKLKPKVVPDEKVVSDIANEVFKPRKHPGICKVQTVSLPDSFVKAAERVLEDYSPKALLVESEVFLRHLKGRLPPIEEDEMKIRVDRAQEKALSKVSNIVPQTESEAERLQQVINNKINNYMRKKVYNWKPIEYNLHKSLVYMMGRSAAEYAVLLKIFSEIAKRDPQFKPRSLFDFGSGVGTVTWAATQFWKHDFFEYFNVDTSRDMNDLAQILLQGGRGNMPMSLKGVFYRQFLPATHNSYDLVVSAYSLLELPSLETRLNTVLNLWNKTQMYLVLVEQGTNAGFKVVSQARDFILQIKKEKNRGHVFSPCPHDKICPRFVANDGTPCNFQVSYFTLPIGQISEAKKELYSYVVLQKGERNEAEDLKWPRIVRETLVRSKHTICRLCTANGKLDEVIFSATKHGKIPYYCARGSKWGDLLPMQVKSIEKAEEEMQSENTPSNNKEINEP